MTNAEIGKTLWIQENSVKQALKSWDFWLCPVAMTTAFTHRLKGTAIAIEGRKVPYFLAIAQKINQVVGSFKNPPGY